MPRRTPKSRLTRVENAVTLRRFTATNVLLVAILAVVALIYLPRLFAGVNIQTIITESVPSSVGGHTDGHTDIGANVKPGSNLTYTLVASNNGSTDTSSNVDLKTKIPAYAQYVSNTSGATYDSSTGVLVRHGSRLQAGHTFSLNFTIQVVSTAPYGKTISTRGWLNYAGTDFFSGYINNVIAVPAPNPPTNLRQDGGGTSSISIAWNAATVNGAHTYISSYSILDSGGHPVSTTAGTTYSQGGLPCGRSFTYQVVAIASAVAGYGSGSAPSAPAKVTVSTATCPSPPPPPPPLPHGCGPGTDNSTCPIPTPTPTPTPTPGSGGGGDTSGGIVDTTPPSVPGNLMATLTGGNLVVTLSWSTATDDNGIKLYKLERSIDNTNWDTLADNLTSTNFDDKTVAFKTHYFYRLSAVDLSGNASGFATTDITTGDFNALGSDTTTIKSDDGIVSVAIPAGTLDAGVDCSITIQTNALPVQPKQAVVVGPYELICKQASGDLVTTFKAPVSVAFQLTKDVLKKFKNFALDRFAADNSQFVTLKFTFDKKTNIISAPLQDTGQIMVLGSVKSNILPGLIITILVVLGLGGGAFVYFLRRAQKQKYEEYLRRKYYNL